LVAGLALAGCGGGGNERRIGDSVDYSFTSNGILTWRVDVHVRANGTVSATGDIAGCPAAPAEVHLAPAAIGRVRAALASARLADQKSIVERDVNVPELLIRSGDVTYRHISWRPLPPAVRPLAAELTRVKALVCGINQSAGP
jgi:hypothetical protein